MLNREMEAGEPVWVYPKTDEEWKASIIKEFKIHPITAQILVSRGFKTLQEIHDYLYSKLPDLIDPFLFKEMKKAVARVIQALDNKETILIYGDNDVDGMTGTALLVDYLRLIGAEALFFVSTPGTPRKELIIEALEYGKQNNCTLLITVDCGITSADEIAKLSKSGIDVIVTDHHEPTDALPHCSATLNPKLHKQSYPNRDLTGVGVAFKLAHALTNTLIDQKRISTRKVDLKRYLDLVALGTISDMGALKEENRILVKYGIQQLRKLKRIGLAQLVKIADVNPKQISTYIVASKIAPRLNSLGRIADPQKGVELLLQKNSAKAEQMAHELDLNNIERQKIERTMSSDIEHMIQKDPEILNQKAIVMHSDKWHPGVIAILSTRISKMYHRPTAMIAIEGDIGKGSLRSISKFPLIPALKKNSDILTNFGGHDFAAGMTIPKDKIDEFKQRFLKEASQLLESTDVTAKLSLDAEVHFEDLTFDLMESIKLFEPFGNENLQPILYTEAKQAWPPKVVGNHLKLFLEQGDRMLEGIAFGKAYMSRKLRKPYRLLVAFTPHVYSQGPSIQLMIRDFKVIGN